MYDPTAVADHSPEQRIEAAQAEVQRIYGVLASPANDWDRHISSARSVMATIDFTPFMYDANRADEQAWLVAGLQRLAYYEPDAGGVADIAEWCVSQWLKILQHHPEHILALQGAEIWSLIGEHSTAPVGRSCILCLTISVLCFEIDRALVCPYSHAYCRIMLSMLPYHQISI